MSKIILPKNSTVKKGKTYSCDNPAKTIKIYRYDPEKDKSPKLDTYHITTDLCGSMVLDTLNAIRKHIDPTLNYRFSCREGLCGSCSMNINGVNSLACAHKMPKGNLTIYPLPHMEIIRDLVVDLSKFFDGYAKIKPWLQTNKTPTKEHIHKDFDRLKGMYECIMCACCSSSCPIFWWHEERFLGPAVLLQACRWLEDSRDESKKERLSYLISDKYKLKQCHNIANCIQACPKKLNPLKSIMKIKKLLIKEGNTCKKK